MMDRTFICYSRKDEAFVDRLVADLKAHGVATWRDVDDIPRHKASNVKSWRAAVSDALKQCSHMIVVLSPDAIDSPEVESEWTYFIGQQRTLIPVICRPCEVPYRLVIYNYWDLTQPQEYAEQLPRIAKHLPKGRPLTTGEYKVIDIPPAAATYPKPVVQQPRPQAAPAAAPPQAYPMQQPQAVIPGAQPAVYPAASVPRKPARKILGMPMWLFITLLVGIITVCSCIACVWYSELNSYPYYGY